MTFQTQLNNINLYRMGQTEDSLETVHDSLSIVTASNHSYSSTDIFKDISDSKVQLYASILVRVYLM
jgi:hypothetical protein